MERSFRSRSPDVSLDADYTAGRKQGTTPSHRLLVAIMRRAIWDFALYREEDPKRFDPSKAKTVKQRRKLEAQRKKAERDLATAEDAAGWLFWDGEEEVDEQGRYTFRYICTMLDLNPAEVRARALSMTREEVQKLNNHIKEE
jgi:hypothetical protein